jgi:PAT family beta-lactamase induction signal transducer AmpG
MADSGTRRIGIQMPLGFASGLPLLLTGGTLTAWLADADVDMAAIGAFALVSLPYNFKFLWAPVLDRYAPPWLGRRRSWMVGFSLLLAVALVVMAGIDAGSAPLAIGVAAVAVAFLSASFDVVNDAYRTDLLPAGERGKGTATYVTGFRVAMLVAGGGALILADWVGWEVTYLVMAGLMLLSTLTIFIAPEPDKSHQPTSLGAAVVRPLVEFFTRRGAILALAIVALYKFGDFMASHMITPFLIDIGFAKTEIGAVQKFGGMAATILGVWVGGALADRWGVVKTLLIFGLLQAMANVGYVFLALTGPSSVGLGGAVFIDNLCNGMGTAAFVAFLMSLCDERYSATQYALLGSASSILGRTLGATSGVVKEEIGWAGFFGVTIGVAVPALLLLVWYLRQETGDERA